MQKPNNDTSRRKIDGPQFITKKAPCSPSEHETRRCQPKPSTKGVKPSPIPVLRETNK